MTFFTSRGLSSSNYQPPFFYRPFPCCYLRAAPPRLSERRWTGLSHWMPLS